MKRQILFIADPWVTLDHARDSTLHFARVAIEEFGARCYWAHAEEVFCEDGVLSTKIDGELKVHENPEKMLERSSETLQLKAFHSVHWRADPPVGLQSLRLWTLLSSTAEPAQINFVNAPHALLLWNEKFSALRFGSWAIPGLIADAETPWKRFFEERMGKRIIVKPSAEAASRGVQILPKTWTESRKVLHDLRETSGPWLLLQEFDESVLLHGETRVFILDGKICGVLNKQPNPKSPIINMDVSPEDRPTIQLAELTPTQRERAETIAKALRADGVYLASVDFIGTRILEINVTSVGLIQWMDKELAKTPKGIRIARQYWEGLIS